MDVVEKDLERIEVINWRNIVQNREKWREVVMTAKTLVEQYKPKEEGEQQYYIILASTMIKL